MPILSVVIPFFNHSEVLGTCLESLSYLTATGQGEVIVVDDGSDPVESTTAERLSVERGVRFVRRDHHGVSSARNAGIAMAAGDFLWFVDADDTAVPSALPSLVATLGALPPDANVLLTGEMSVGDEELPMDDRSNGKLRMARYTELLRPVSRAPIRTSLPRASNHTLCVIRRQWLLDNSQLRYPKGQALLEDTVFVLNVMRAAEMVADNASLHVYRLHKERPSTTSGAWSDQRSQRFIADLEFFFSFLKDYCSPEESLMPLYRCYRFVYLRTIAVKGVPWSDVLRLRQAVELHTPYIPLERLLFFAPTHKFLTMLCRLIRKRR